MTAPSPSCLVPVESPRSEEVADPVPPVGGLSTAALLFGSESAVAAAVSPSVVAVACAGAGGHSSEREISRAEIAHAKKTRAISKDLGRDLAPSPSPTPCRCSRPWRYWLL